MSVDSATSVSQAKQSDLQFQVGIAVMKKQQDALHAQAGALVAMLQDVAQMSQAAGKGEQCDLCG